MRQIIIILFVLALSLSSAAAAIQEKEVSYRTDDTVMNGYIAYDDTVDGKRPGILVVHEWWGHNDYVRKRARMLAEKGYTALAVDMYGEGKQADHPSEAGEFSSMVKKNMAAAESRFKAAMTVLENHGTVDANRIAAIGYCFGGGIVLEMARRGVDLDAVVSFHGSLSTDSPARKGDVKARVLVFNGAADKFVSDEAIAAFKQEMDAAGVDYNFINYPGAIHSFTNPAADRYAEKFGIPVGYDAEADRKSWQTMLEFLRETF